MAASILANFGLSKKVLQAYSQLRSFKKGKTVENHVSSRKVQRGESLSYLISSTFSFACTIIQRSLVNSSSVRNMRVRS
jgi:hypothetical protein